MAYFAAFLALILSLRNSFEHILLNESICASIIALVRTILFVLLHLPLASNSTTFILVVIVAPSMFVFISISIVL